MYILGLVDSTSVDRVRESRIRRAWLRRGLVFVKVWAEQQWIVYDRIHRARTARVFYSLDEAEQALEDEPDGAHEAAA